MDQKTNLIISIATVAAAVVVFVLMCFDKRKFSTRAVAYGAICLAMSFGLSYVRMFKLPQGGSITAASMLPIMLYAYVFGAKRGTLIGLIFAGLQSLQDLFFVSVIQYILDYPLAFMSVGIVGLARFIPTVKEYPIGFLVGIVASCLVRYVCHAISGAVFFAEYASGNVWIYTFTYNAFVLVECAICLVVGGLLFTNRSARKFLLKKA